MKTSLNKKDFLKYLHSLGLNVNTRTKARGNKGFFSGNRIDISKNVEDERFFDTLAHEFAHYVHSKIEPDNFKNGGSLKILFNCNYTKEIERELIQVTNFIDPNSKLERLLAIKEEYKKRIKYKEAQIKSVCPDFQKSKPYKPFDKVIRKSKAKYLLKHDRIKLITPFLKRIEQYSIATAHLDFPELKPEFIDILKLKSLQKKQTNNSRRINKYKKYYGSPVELFARFIQSLVYDEQITKTIAPITCERFYRLLEQGFYRELSYLFK
ncbi:hypothetical protein IJS77_01110 [bacterium]|nr:hypothetical protein [bacterium]